MPVWSVLRWSRHAILHNLRFVFAFLGLITAISVISQMRPDTAGYILIGMNVLVNGWTVLLAMMLLPEHCDS